MTEQAFQGMRGIIKKKGRHAMQGYKDREFVIDEKGYMKYGPPGQSNKWEKKIKLTDIISIEPSSEEPRHSFRITKKDGRIFFFAAENDQDKWKWISGFREAVAIANDPNWTPINNSPSINSRQLFMTIQKLSKISVTGIWRWRFCYIDDSSVTYYRDPAQSEPLGSFQFKAISGVSYVNNKHAHYGKIVQVDIKFPEKRSYFFDHTNRDTLKQFFDILNANKKKGFFG